MSFLISKIPTVVIDRNVMKANQLDASVDGHVKYFGTLWKEFPSLTEKFYNRSSFSLSEID